MSTLGPGQRPHCCSAVYSDTAKLWQSSLVWCASCTSRQAVRKKRNEPNQGSTKYPNQFLCYCHLPVSSFPSLLYHQLQHRPSFLPPFALFFFLVVVCPNPAKSLQPATSRTPHPVNRSIFLVPATPALLLPHDSTNTCARPLPRLASLISPSDRSFRRLLFSFTISLEWQFPLAQFYPSLPFPRRLPCRPRQRTPSPTFQLQPAVACASVYSASAARLWPREPI